MGPVSPPEPVPGSEVELEVTTDTGAVPVALRVAAAPAAPGTVPPGGDSGVEPDVRVEKVVWSDRDIKPVLAVKLVTVPVATVLFEYETLMVDAAAVGVGVPKESEVSLDGEEDSADEEGVTIAVFVNEVSEGIGEDGGDESTD